MEVEIARDIEALVPNYLNNRRADANNIKQLLADGKLDAVGKLGHRMKGNGASFGFHPISELGANLEEASACGETDSVQRLLDELVQFLDELTVVYR